jgi:glutaredoxin
VLRRILARWFPPTPPPLVRLYTRRACPLCDEMKRELARSRARFELHEVDIEQDPALLERHGRSIPVLEIAGRVAFKGRLTAADFERTLARRLAEVRPGRAQRPEGERGD